MDVSSYRISGKFQRDFNFVSLRNRKIKIISNFVSAIFYTQVNKNHVEVFAHMKVNSERLCNKEDS